MNWENLEDVQRLHELGGWVVDPAEETEALPLPGAETECTKQWPDGILIKSKWGEGPWILEPDFVVFRAKAPPHYRGAVWRQFMGGQLNGYVVVPRGHPVHGLGMHELDQVDVHTHGGLTFGAPMPSGSWLVGFHTARTFDYQPAFEARGRWNDPRTAMVLDKFAMRPVYRDLTYVRAQVESLALQLGAMAKGGAS